MDALRELQDPDVIQRPPKGWPEPGPFVGREASMRQFEQLRDTWDSDSAKPISAFVDIADHVIVRYLWRGLGEGPESNIELTALYTVRKGKIFYQEFFWDHAEAPRSRRAVGARRSRRLLSLRDTARSLSSSRSWTVKR
jgi:ketosteroid isomerase-like protein